MTHSTWIGSRRIGIIRAAMRCGLMVSIVFTAACSSHERAEHGAEGKWEPLGAVVRAEFETNAALWYWAAFSEFDAYSDEEFDALVEALYEEGDDEAAREQHREAEQVLHECMIYVRQAVEKERCVFGVDRSEGIGALLPHVPKMKRLGRLLLADAGRETGDREADLSRAIERFGQLLIMADHIHQDRLLIGHLTGRGMLVDVLDMVEHGLENDLFSDEQKRQLRAMLLHVHCATREAYVESIQGEWEITTPWFRREFAGADGYARLCEDIPELASPEGDAFDPQEFDAVLDGLDEAYADLIEVVQAGDDDAVISLSNAIIDGQYGYFAQAFLGSQDWVYTGSVYTRKRLQTVCEDLKEID
jgi:hypothetical protein